MSATKDHLEQLSIEMGFGGEINDAVIGAAEGRNRTRVYGDPSLVDEALRLLRFGWSVMPVTGKRPAWCVGKWSEYKSRRAEDYEMQSWCSDRRVTGIAVIGGAVSGGLVIRDFDSVDAYAAWAAIQPHLAETLPTSRTKRGYHVFARVDGLVRGRTFADGELRAEGQYVVIPPSKHPDGGRYEWIRKPTGDIPVVGLEVFCDQ